MNHCSMLFDTFSQASRIKEFRYGALPLFRSVHNAGRLVLRGLGVFESGVNVNQIM